jgi:hypothetical protein
MAIRMTGAATTPPGKTISVRVYRPDMGLSTPSNAYSSASAIDPGTLNLTSLPATGVYTVVVQALAGVPSIGSLVLVPGAASGTVSEDMTQHLAASVPGQVLLSSFDAGLGGNLNFTLGGMSNGGVASTGINVVIRNSAGVAVDSYACHTSDPACGRELWNMPGGLYSVTVTPANVTQTLSFDAAVRHTRSVGSLVLGQPVDVGHAVGESLRGTFHATKGDTVALQLAGVVTTPASKNANIRIYRPGNGLVSTANAYSSFSTTTTGTLNLADLPDTGEYTVVVSSDYSVPATASLTLVPGSSGAVLTEGATQHIASHAAGQNVYASFDAGQGGDLVLALNGIQAPGGTSSGFTVSVYTAAGVSVDSFTCYRTDPACARDMWDLAAGIYDIIIVPNGLQTISFDAVIRHNRDLGIMQRGVPVDVARETGDELRLVFDAEQGDTVALQMTGVSTLPAGRNVSVRIYNPASGRVLTTNAYSSFSTTSTNMLNLPELPATGRYVVVVSADYALPSPGVLTLVEGVAGTRISDGVVQHLEARISGQTLNSSFEAADGGNVTFTLSNATVEGGASSSYYLTINDPRGAVVATVTCYKTDPGCSKELWNLSPGVYDITITPQTGQRISLDAVVKQHGQLASLTYGAAMDVSRGVAQTWRTTFTAALGDSVRLSLSGVASTPTGRNTNVFVFRPDGGQIKVEAPYVKLVASKDSVFELPSLPVGGVYTVVIGSDYGLAAQGVLTATRTAAP